MIVDTHTHLYTEAFDADRADAVARARAAGVGCLLLPNIDEASIPRMIAMCDDYPDLCFPMIGLHPQDVRDDCQEVLGSMKAWLDADQREGALHRFVGIGEVGLDFYRDDTYKARQLEALEQQMAWAAAYTLPLVVHARAAFDALYRLFDRHRGEGLTGIFHCFGGTAEEAEALLSFEGFMLGIGGVLTYKNSSLPEVLRTVPVDRVVVETDAPYLAPVPHRGRRNEPAFIVDTVRKLAEVWGCTPDEAIRQTTANAARLFPAIIPSACKEEHKG